MRERRRRRRDRRGFEIKVVQSSLHYEQEGGFERFRGKIVGRKERRNEAKKVIGGREGTESTQEISVWEGRKIRRSEKL